MSKKHLPLNTLFSATALLFATTALAAEEAHEHGVSVLNIAIEGNEIAFELESPGADIVGFEHEAKSHDDIEAIEAAVAALKEPLLLFSTPEAAGCSVAEIEIEAPETDHDEEHDEDQNHDDDHAHDDDHDHDEETHSEFHAEFTYACLDRGKITEIDVAFFERFPNAERLNVQMVSSNGSLIAKLTPSATKLDISSLF